MMKIKSFKEVNTWAWRSLFKKRIKKEEHFSFFMFHYIISDKNCDLQNQNTVYLLIEW